MRSRGQGGHKKRVPFMRWVNAFSMLVASLAEVSMKNIFSLAATFFPSSTLTHRCNMRRNRADETTIESERCAGLVRERLTFSLKSSLLPTSVTTTS